MAKNKKRKKLFKAVRFILAFSGFLLALFFAYVLISGKTYDLVQALTFF